MLEWKERHRPGHPIRKIKVSIDSKVVAEHNVNSDWTQRGVAFRAQSSSVALKLDGVDTATGEGSVYLDDVHVLSISDSMLNQVTSQCNLLKNPDLNQGWSKSYNKDIVWHDGDLPIGVTDIGATVVSFR